MISFSRSTRSAQNRTARSSATDTAESTTAPADIKAMTEDRAFFNVVTLDAVEDLRAIESDFGILPMPKYNAQQDSYKSHVQQNYSSAMSIPNVVTDYELIGKVLEEMVYQSMLTVKPTNIDIPLGSKYIRDPESRV